MKISNVTIFTPNPIEENGNRTVIRQNNNQNQSQ